MSWSKLKQNLESFLCPALQGRVEYRATSYRYLPDKAGSCYIAVDKKNVFNMSDKTTLIKWYQTEQEIKNDSGIQTPISNEEIEVLRKVTKGLVPEDRLLVIARSRKLSELAKELLSAQSSLSKSNFIVVANKFLSTPLEESLESNDILMNILALVDRRLGKKRILNMAEKIKLKHPIVQYFYALRLSKL
ncbi:SF0329 family protein [Psychrobacillus sp. FSL H8-0510]|uniref:SF0329 family protein n=1 Tax=Psychrobacillus sp. FSL H8-0510 TaxID=2921394 RepID=UPI0030FCE56E